MTTEFYFASEDPRAQYPSEERKPGQGFRVDVGFAVNPWESFPRNAACPCLSGKKWKSCHLKKISPVIESSKVPKIKALIKEFLEGE